MIRTTARTAAKPHYCEMCSRWIQKGERYLEMVASPDHEDLGNISWWRLPECSDCAIRYGRSDKLEGKEKCL